MNGKYGNLDKYYIGQSIVTGEPLFWAWKNHPIMSMLSGHGDRIKGKKKGMCFKIEFIPTKYFDTKKAEAKLLKNIVGNVADMPD